MKVFSVYRESELGVVGQWMRAWESRGHRPLLILPGVKSAREAVKKGGGGLLITAFMFPNWPEELPKVKRGQCLKASLRWRGLKHFPEGTTREEVSRYGFI